MNNPIDTLIGLAWRGEYGPKMDAAIDAALNAVKSRICPDCGGQAVRRDHEDGIVDAKCSDCGVVVGWDQCPCPAPDPAPAAKEE
jgi:ribosomal protein L37AE/L43A